LNEELSVFKEVKSQRVVPMQMGNDNDLDLIRGKTDGFQSIDRLLALVSLNDIPVIFQTLIWIGGP
jgi:hypothetical protein